MTYVILLGLLIVGSAALALLKSFSILPEVELKRRAAAGHKTDRALYRAGAFGASLRMLLWLIALPTLAAALVLLARHTSLAVTVVIFAAYAGIYAAVDAHWLHGAAGKSAPLLAWVLERGEGVLRPVAKRFNAVFERPAHSGLYEADDLYQLLERQKTQADNRISIEDLERAQRMLQFGATYAADIVQPLRQLPTVEAHESLGPIVLDELHASHQTAFLVYDGEPDNIVGTLSLDDAAQRKQGGQVGDLMHPGVTSVPESASLPEVLTVLSTTNQQLGVVVSDSGDVTGSISLAQVVAELSTDLPPEDEQHEQAPEAVAEI